jgi:predicted DNA-binding transcriptional regulator YafY
MKTMTDEKRIRARIISLLTDLINSPKIYKKAEFAQRYNVDLDTISDDFDEMGNAGFSVRYTNDYRYYIDYADSLTNLQKELHFTVEERDMISSVLTTSEVSEARRSRILRKLESLLDVAKVTNQVLNKVHLEKINALHKAQDEECKVELINYRSSHSRAKASRIVEPYHVNPKENIIHAYDYNRAMVRFFRINRIEGIKLLDEKWEKAGTHRNARAADAFGMVSKNLVSLHVRMDICAYNYLIERFPDTQGFCNPCPTNEDKFDLECDVNEEFLGVTNFLIGYHEHIENVFEPYELIEHLNKKVKKISF